MPKRCSHQSEKAAACGCSSTVDASPGWVVVVENRRRRPRMAEDESRTKQFVDVGFDLRDLVEKVVGTKPSWWHVVLVSESVTLKLACKDSIVRLGEGDSLVRYNDTKKPINLKLHHLNLL